MCCGKGRGSCAPTSAPPLFLLPLLHPLLDPLSHRAPPHHPPAPPCPLQLCGLLAASPWLAPLHTGALVYLLLSGFDEDTSSVAGLVRGQGAGDGGGGGVGGG